MCDILNYSFDDPPDNQLVNDLKTTSSSHTNSENITFPSEENTQHSFDLVSRQPLETYKAPNNSEEDDDVDDDGDEFITSKAKEIFKDTGKLASYIGLGTETPEHGDAEERGNGDVVDANGPYPYDADDNADGVARGDSLQFYGDEFSSEDDDDDDDDDEEDEEGDEDDIGADEMEGDGRTNEHAQDRDESEQRANDPSPSNEGSSEPRQSPPQASTSSPCQWGGNSEAATNKLLERELSEIPCTCSHLLHATSDQIQGWSGFECGVGNHRGRYHRKHHHKQESGVGATTKRNHHSHHHRQTQHWTHHNSAFPRRDGGGGGGASRWASHGTGGGTNAAAGASEIHHSNSLMVGDHKAFLSTENDVPFVFRHYSDTKKYMEQYRKVHTKGDIYQRPIDDAPVIGFDIPDPYLPKLRQYSEYFERLAMLGLLKMHPKQPTKRPCGAGKTNEEGEEGGDDSRGSSGSGQQMAGLRFADGGINGALGGRKIKGGNNNNNTKLPDVKSLVTKKQFLDRGSYMDLQLPKAYFAIAEAGEMQGANGESASYLEYPPTTRTRKLKKPIFDKRFFGSEYLEFLSTVAPLNHVRRLQSSGDLGRYFLNNIQSGKDPSANLSGGGALSRSTQNLSKVFSDAAQTGSLILGSTVNRPTPKPKTERASRARLPTGMSELLHIGIPGGSATFGEAIMKQDEGGEMLHLPQQPIKPNALLTTSMTSSKSDANGKNSHDKIPPLPPPPPPVRGPNRGGNDSHSNRWRGSVTSSALDSLGVKGSTLRVDE